MALDIDAVKVIDTDTHVIEPYDLWTSRISVKRWGNLVPHVRWDEKMSEDAWFFGDERVCSATSSAWAGWREYPPLRPQHLSEADPTTYDPVRRLALMDDYGIHAQVLYPNVAGFGAGRFLGLREPELMLACVHAYNDFLSEWGRVAPGRFIPIMALPIWDVEASIAEMHRCIGNGHKGIVLSSQPENWGQPHITDTHWDPMWTAAQDLELSINFHVAGGDATAAIGVAKPLPHAGRHANLASMGPLGTMTNSRAISNLICGGVCHRFPRLNFVSVESGVGWIPYALSCLDWMWKNCGVHVEYPEYDLLPSEYFQRQIYGCFWFEDATLRATVDVIGCENLLYETDFPHSTSMSPGPATDAVKPRHFIERQLGDLPDEALRMMLHDNAARLYHLD
jgi:predicted TIM-barrel fold metal-dependent hydrolase